MCHCKESGRQSLRLMCLWLLIVQNTSHSCFLKINTNKSFWHTECFIFVILCPHRQTKQIIFWVVSSDLDMKIPNYHTSLLITPPMWLWPSHSLREKIPKPWKWWPKFSYFNILITGHMVLSHKNSFYPPCK